MMLLTEVLNASSILLNVCGAIIVLFGSLWAFLRWITEEVRGTAARTDIIDTIRRTYSRFLLLGLEFLIAGDILRTVQTRQWEDLVSLGAYIVLRLILGATLKGDIRSPQAGTRRR